MYNRDDRGGGNRRDFRRDRPQMFPATCDKCGQSCQVPFRPSGEKPVYCSACFDRNGGGDRRDDRRGGDNRGSRNSYGGGDRASNDQYKKQLDEIISKLDSILFALKPVKSVEPVKAKAKKPVKPSKV